MSKEKSAWLVDVSSACGGFGEESIRQLECCKVESPIVEALCSERGERARAHQRRSGNGVPTV
jgi:hypothetical protein